MAKRSANHGDVLFVSSANNSNEPLAARMRPRTLDEFVGQDHIVGPGRLLRRAIQADQLSSLILAGPPGTGKTTLARVIANSTACGFQALNAVLPGVAEIREAIAKAQEQRSLYDRRTILFVDEVHRWNRAQQDALLPWVENGTFVLIGATTENPFFEVNAALVSRSRIFMLRPLSRNDLLTIVQQTLTDRERGYGKYQVMVDDDALSHLVDTCNGDARTLLNALELAVETTPQTFPPAKPQESIHITRDVAEDSIQKKVVLYDKEGDYHFDTISAFIKSIRGSDPDAALYWLARMVAGGEDPRYIFRRLLIAASEDVGLADPQALVVVQSAVAAYERVGLPEGQFFLSQATLYLATAPKSNSTIGYFDALSHQTQRPEATDDVPNHLRDGNRDGDAFGHGKAYLYPHAYRDHWVAQTYLPSNLKDQVYYQPSNQGYEATIANLVADRKWEQLSLAVQDTEEPYSYSPEDKRLAGFVKRFERAEKTAYQLTSDMLTLLACPRHGRIALFSDQTLGLVPQVLASVPEGQLVLITPVDEQMGMTRFLTENLPTLSADAWIVQDNTYQQAEFGLSTWSNHPEFWSSQIQLMYTVSQTGAIWVVRVPNYQASSRPSSVLADLKLRAVIEMAEKTWMALPESRGFQTDFDRLRALTAESGWSIDSESATVHQAVITLNDTRIARWLNLAESPYAAGIKNLVSAAEWSAFQAAISQRQGTTAVWNTHYQLLRIIKL